MCLYMQNIYVSQTEVGVRSGPRPKFACIFEFSTGDVPDTCAVWKVLWMVPGIGSGYGLSKRVGEGNGEAVRPKFRAKI